jgi:hypothetical protein
MWTSNVFSVSSGVSSIWGWKVWYWCMIFLQVSGAKIPSKDTCHLVWDVVFFGIWISIMEETTVAVFSVRVEDGSNLLSRNLNKFLPTCTASHHKRKCPSQSRRKLNPAKPSLSVVDCYRAFRGQQLRKPRTAISWKCLETGVPICNICLITCIRFRRATVKADR